MTVFAFNIKRIVSWFTCLNFGDGFVLYADVLIAWGSTMMISLKIMIMF
jgi:hypothetical protein